MANGKLNRAQVGLALASAFVVLLSSGVAISRISDGDDESPVATGPSSTSSTLPGTGQPGPATSSGPASGADAGGVAEAASAEAASGASAAVGGVKRSGRKAKSAASSTPSPPAAVGASPAPGPGTAGGSVTPGGGSQDGGQETPPAPSQIPPDETPLATAHVSAGEGAQGAVVGVDLGNGQPAEADVTVGTDQLVGDHPPSDGTGVDFGGRLFIHPPASVAGLT